MSVSESLLQTNTVHKIMSLLFILLTKFNGYLNANEGKHIEIKKLKMNPTL